MSDIDLRVTKETETQVDLEWDPVEGQEGFVPTIDGSDVLTDGKRHVNTSKEQTYVRVAKPAGGEPHDYGVTILGNIASGTVTVPEGDGPPAGDGYGQALLDYLPPLPADAPIILEGESLTETLKITKAGRVQDVYVGPGFHDGFYIKHGDVELLRCMAEGCVAPEGEDEVQSIFFDPVDNVRIFEFISRDSGATTKEHPFYVHGHNQLFASVLAIYFAGYGYHGYGDSSQSVMTHATLAWSKLRWLALVYPEHDLTIRNSILAYPRDGPGVREEGGVFKVYNSCVWPKPTTHLDWYIDCIFEDPQLDASTGRPRNTKVLNWAADPDWAYPTDVYGKPINCIGAVAA